MQSFDKLLRQYR